MADIIQPVAPHDPGAGVPETNLPHTSPTEEPAAPPVAPAPAAPPPVLQPNPAAGAKQPGKKITKDE